MTETTIIRYINALNKGKAEDYIFIQPLTEMVDFATIIDQIRNPITKVRSLFMPLKFYFIKNEEGIYVAAVSDMYSNLHWVVLPKYRGNGFLTNALISIILPHIFQDNRNVQGISINLNEIGKKNYKASHAVAKKVGFRITKSASGNDKLEISRSTFKIENCISEKYNGMEEERFKLIKQRAIEFSKELCKIQIELEMKFGMTDKVLEFKEITDLTNKIPSLMHGIFWCNE